MLKKHKPFTNMPAIILLTTLLMFISQSCNTTDPDNDNGGNGTDTTSQNFTFETFEFGDGGSSSYFNDVWVFDENNIWAVGYISADSPYVNGNYISNPNIIKWNGTDWELQPFSGTSSGIEGIWAVDSSKIYFANGIVVKYEHGKYEYEDFSRVPHSEGQAVHKLWGSSESNIWGVGPWGTVVHYDGVSWKKIEFDRQWYFYDITGDKETGVAYATAISPEDDGLVVKLENFSASIIYRKSESVIKVSSRTITYVDDYLYIAGSDLQSTKICKMSETGIIEKLKDIDPTIGVSQSHAVSKNDIYYLGPKQSETGLIHYNGTRYSIYGIHIDPDNYGAGHAIADLAVSVGFTNNKAYLIKIKRG